MSQAVHNQQKKTIRPALIFLLYLAVIMKSFRLQVAAQMKTAEKNSNTDSVDLDDNENPGIKILESIKINIWAERHRSVHTQYCSLNTKINTEYSQLPLRRQSKSYIAQQFGREPCAVSLDVHLLKDYRRLRTLCLFREEFMDQDNLFHRDTDITIEGLRFNRADLYKEVKPVVGFIVNEPNSLVKGYLINQRFYGTVRLYDVYRLYHIVFYIEPASTVHLYSKMYENSPVDLANEHDNAVLFEYVSNAENSVWQLCGKKTPIPKTTPETTTASSPPSPSNPPSTKPSPTPHSSTYSTNSEVPSESSDAFSSTTTPLTTSTNTTRRSTPSSTFAPSSSSSSSSTSSHRSSSSSTISSQSSSSPPGQSSSSTPGQSTTSTPGQSSSSTSGQSSSSSSSTSSSFSSESSSSTESTTSTTRTANRPFHSKEGRRLYHATEAFSFSTPPTTIATGLSHSTESVYNTQKHSTEWTNRTTTTPGTTFKLHHSTLIDLMGTPSQTALQHSTEPRPPLHSTEMTSLSTTPPTSPSTSRTTTPVVSSTTKGTAPTSTTAGTTILKISTSTGTTTTPKSTTTTPLVLSTEVSPFTPSYYHSTEAFPPFEMMTGQVVKLVNAQQIEFLKGPVTNGTMKHLTINGSPALLDDKLLGAIVEVKSDGDEAPLFIGVIVKIDVAGSARAGATGTLVTLAQANSTQILWWDSFFTTAPSHSTEVATAPRHSTEVNTPVTTEVIIKSTTSDTGSTRRDPDKLGHSTEATTKIHRSTEQFPPSSTVAAPSTTSTPISHSTKVVSPPFHSTDGGAWYFEETTPMAKGRILNQISGNSTSTTESTTPKTTTGTTTTTQRTTTVKDGTTTTAAPVTIRTTAPYHSTEGTTWPFHSTQVITLPTKKTTPTTSSTTQTPITGTSNTSTITPNPRILIGLPQHSTESYKRFHSTEVTTMKSTLSTTISTSSSIGPSTTTSTREPTTTSTSTDSTTDMAPNPRMLSAESYELLPGSTASVTRGIKSQDGALQPLHSTSAGPMRGTGMRPTLGFWLSTEFGATSGDERHTMDPSKISLSTEVTASNPDFSTEVQDPGQPQSVSPFSLDDQQSVGTTDPPTTSNRTTIYPNPTSSSTDPTESESESSNTDETIFSTEWNETRETKTTAVTVNFQGSSEVTTPSSQVQPFRDLSTEYFKEPTNTVAETSTGTSTIIQTPGNLAVPIDSGLQQQQQLADEQRHLLKGQLAGGRRRKRRALAFNFKNFFGQENLLADEDVGEDVGFTDGVTSSDMFDLRTDKAFVCELCLWIQPHFAESFGLGGGLMHGVAEIIDVIRFTDWVFRSIDFNQDGLAENIGLVIQKIVLTDDVKLAQDPKSYHGSTTLNPDLNPNPGETSGPNPGGQTSGPNPGGQSPSGQTDGTQNPGSSSSRRKKRQAQAQNEKDYAKKLRKKREDIFDDYDYDSAHWDNSNSLVSGNSDPRSYRTLRKKLNDFSRQPKVLVPKNTLLAVEDALRNNFSSCCAILSFIYHDMTPTIAATNQRGLCSDKNVGVVSGYLHKHKIAKFDVFRGVMHTLGHLFGANHDSITDADCYDRQLYDYLNPFPLHPVQQTNVGVRPNSFKFSRCAKDQITMFLSSRAPTCLKSQPSNFCGNGMLEEGEDCDCGSPWQCHLTFPCCGESDTFSGCKIINSAKKSCHRPTIW